MTKRYRVFTLLFLVTYKTRWLEDGDQDSCMHTFILYDFGFLLQHCSSSNALSRSFAGFQMLA